MDEKIQNQNMSKTTGIGQKEYESTDFLSKEEASEFLGLKPNNRNSLYWWKRKVMPGAVFPKKGKKTLWPVFFLQQVIDQRIENLQSRRIPR